VVTPAQALMVVVPSGVTLETIRGEVADVSSDAIQDDKLGLVYSTRIAMSRVVMNVDGRDVNMSPGMAATVEIKTDQRRLIEYLLSPLLRDKQESLRPSATLRSASQLRLSNRQRMQDADRVSHVQALSEPARRSGLGVQDEPFRIVSARRSSTGLSGTFGGRGTSGTIHPFGRRNRSSPSGNRSSW
jgi:hypothetical protein